MERIGNFGNKPEYPAEPRPLHVCGAGCGCELVSPLKIDNQTPFIEHVDEDQWRMILLCPDCGNVEEGVYTTGQIDEYDLHTRAERARMNADVTALQRESMEDYVEQSIAALNADYILPEDF